MPRGLFRKKGYFSEEGLDRQLQDLEQDVDDSLRALSTELEAVKATTKTTLEKNEEDIKETSEVANRTSSDTSALDSRVTALEAPQPHVEGNFALSTAYTNAANVVIASSTTQGGMTVVSDTVVVPEDGLYLISFVIKGTQTATANPLNTGMRVQVNGSNVLWASSVRYSASTSDPQNIQGTITKKLIASDVIRWRSPSSAALTTTANAEENSFSVTKVSE